jgi:hypothetical protein
MEKAFSAVPIVSPGPIAVATVAAIKIRELNLVEPTAYSFKDFIIGTLKKPRITQRVR